jgi:hypothetical protein
MNQEDRSRPEEFRQLGKEIRGSAEYLVVGIDVAKDKHYAFFSTATHQNLPSHFKSSLNDFSPTGQRFMELLTQKG